MSLLADLGLDLDAPDVETPQSASITAVVEAVWNGLEHLRPVKFHAGDWLTRAFDAGLPYEQLLSTAVRFSAHLAPTFDVPSTSSRSATGRGRRNSRTSAIPTGGEPLYVALALTRADDETEREHLARMGRQARVFDLPESRPFLVRTARHSAFDEAPPLFPLAAVLASSPFTVDRLALVERDDTPTDVLDGLAADPTRGVRSGVAAHPNISEDAAHLLMTDSVDEVSAAVRSNPVVSAEFKAGWRDATATR